MYRILALSSALAVIAGAGYAFDRETTNALRACHDYLWDVPEFAELPNAAISVFPASQNGDTIVVNWNVAWDQPMTRGAGNCTVINGEIAGFEDYTK